MKRDFLLIFLRLFILYVTQLIIAFLNNLTLKLILFTKCFELPYLRDVVSTLSLLEKYHRNIYYSEGWSKL